MKRGRGKREEGERGKQKGGEEDRRGERKKGRKKVKRGRKMGVLLFLKGSLGSVLYGV